MQRTEEIERDICCSICSAGLSELERKEYGDVCVFCGLGHRKKELSFWEYIRGAILDYKIHKLKITIVNNVDYYAILDNLGKRSYGEISTLEDRKEIVKERLDEPCMDYYAILGNLGKRSYEEIVTLEDRREIVNELKKLLKFTK